MTPETLTLTAPIDLSAAAGDGTKPRSFKMVAYTGGPMRVSAWADPVVIDLAGLASTDRQRPILLNHSFNKVVGHSTRVETRNGSLFAEGVISGAGKAAKEVVASAGNGFPWQASVGLTVTAREELRAGQSTTVNGKKVDGPAIVARKSELSEISFVPLGADQQTAAMIAAKTQNQGNNMTTENTVTDSNAQERGHIIALTDIRAKYKADYPTRVEEIETKFYAALEANTPTNEFELDLIRSMRPKLTAPVRSGAPSGARSRDLLAAAVAIHAGRSDMAAKAWGERTAQAAADLRCHSLVDLCALALRADMKDVPSDRNEMIRAAISTSSLPTALGDYANKVSADAFQETPAVWRTIARRRPVNNFHAQRISRVLLVGELKELAPGGMIEHGQRTETTKTVSAGTKALMLGIDRRDIINDDLGTFNDTTVALAMAAARTMNDDFASLILENAGNFFHADNANYLAGATAGTNDTRMTTEGLTRGINAMQSQTDDAGRIVDVRPAVLLVPPALELAADQLINSAEVMRSVASIDNQPTGNALQRRLTRVTEPRLASSVYGSGYSVAAWYLFAQPQAGAVNVAFLNGKETPTIETAELDFKQLGIQFRAYIDYGFAFGEPLAAFKAKGAA